MRGTPTNRIVEQVRGSFWRRPDVLATWVMIGAPILMLLVAGIYFVFTEGWFLEFAFASISCVMALYAFRYFWHKWRVVRVVEDIEVPEILINRSWGQFEQQVFQENCARIKERTRELINWDEGLIVLALEIADNVAGQLSDGKRDGFDVSFPELLRGIDQISAECQDFINDTVVFSFLRNLSIGNALWVLRNRRLITTTAKRSDYLFKFAGLVLNPPTGAVRLLESLISSDNTRYLSDQFQIELQRTILNYVAARAVDLYSGRFKQAVPLDSGAPTSEPVRILLVGQTGSGKSSLAAALSGSSRVKEQRNGADSGDAGARIVLDGVQCMLVEKKGIDSSADAAGFRQFAGLVASRVLPGGQELAGIGADFLGCDMIIWILRADQPARKVDIDHLKIFQQAYAIDKWRLVPPLLVVNSHVDRSAVIRSWPADGVLSPAQRLKIDMVAETAAGPFEGYRVVPAKLDQPAWNIDTLVECMKVALPDACFAQNNRLRSHDARKPDEAATPAAKLGKAAFKVLGGGMDAGVRVSTEARNQLKKAANKAKARIRKLMSVTGIGKWPRGKF